MKLNDAVKYCYDIAKTKGWHDEPRSALEIHALIHTEIAEATEDVREGKLHYYLDENKKPSGEATELVDVVIRIFDHFGHQGWNFEDIFKAKCAFNKTRPYRHGKKI